MTGDTALLPPEALDKATAVFLRGGSVGDMLAAAAPAIIAAERDRIRRPSCAPGGYPPNLICMECLRPVCRHCGGCECAGSPALCLPVADLPVKP